MRALRVLVSDAETPAALAVVRSLGRARHRVAVLSASRHAAAAASRHTCAAVAAPDPEGDPDGWTEALLSTVRRSAWDVFLPVTDTAVILADEVRGELVASTLPALPSAAALPVLLDKRRVLDRAGAIGIPVLRRWTRAAAENAPLPAVVKPGRSRARGFRRVRRGTAVVVSDRRRLAAETERFTRAGLGAYAEPWIPGEGRGIFLLRHEGEILARFAHRRIREASPLGGPSAVAESVAPDPDLLRHAEALARELDVEGPFMAEFRGRGRELVLLEVNARFWGSLGLAVDAGVDFPALYVRALAGDPAPGPSSYAVGIRRRNLAFDLRHALRVLRGRPAGLTIPWPGRIRTLAALTLDPAAGLVHKRGDRAPARAHALHLLGKAVRRG